jgi:hypothetical protein
MSEAQRPVVLEQRVERVREHFVRAVAGENCSGLMR